MAVIEVPNKTYITIGGVDVTNYLSKWKIARAYGDDVSQIEISLSSRVTSILTLDETSIGDEVIVKRGATTGQEKFIFRGEISTFNLAGTIISMVCYDKLYEARRASVTKSFDKNIDTEAGNIAEIFSTLINDYTDNLVADSSSVQTTEYTLNKFICNNADVLERCQKLAGTIGWAFFYNPEDELVYFQPKGFVENTLSLVVGENIVEVPVWSFDSSQLANQIKVIGAEQEVETTELFNGTGSQDTFVLSNTPVSVKVYVGSTLQSGGSAGQTEGTYDYEVDQENKKIIFTSGNEPGAGTNNVEVRYSYMLPAPVTGRSQPSIDNYGTFEKTIFSSNVKTRDDAKTFLSGYLDEYAEPFVNTKLKMVSATDVDPGEVIAPVDSFNDVTKSVIVLKVTMQFPYKYDEIECGDKILRLEEWLKGLNDRLRALEEEAGKSQDLLLHVIDLYREDVSFYRRFFQQRKKELTGDGFILGNSAYGVLGTDKLGDTGDSFSDFSIVQGENDYRELLHDNDFVNESSSTMTLNTSTSQLTGTVGQIGKSDCVSCNDQNIVSCAVTVRFTGNITFEVGVGADISTEPTTWETVSVTSAVETDHTFTQTGKSLWWRVTCTDTVALAPATDAYGRTTGYAIRLREITEAT